MSDFLNDLLDSDEELDDIEDKNISFLKNSKQVGEKPTGIVIYIEDYVYTYLYQYAKFNRGEEKAAALVGNYVEEADKKMTVISGAIKIDSTLSEKDNFLTDEKIDDINKKIDMYFPDSELVGWMHTQPGYGIFLTTRDLKIQKQFFKKPYQTLMIIDPIENTEAFFMWDKKEVRSVEGYFVYYDKNESMQNYMINHKIGVSNEELEQKEDVVMQFRKKTRERKQEIQNKKILHLGTFLSLVLFLMCITMAIGLIHHRERLSRLEKELNNMDSNYTNLFNQLNEEDVQVVFAETEEIPKENELPKKDNNESLEELIIIEENTVKEDSIEETSKEETKEEIIEETIEETIEEKTPKEEINNNSKNIEYDTYIVKKGDNLSRICYTYYKSLYMIEKIVEINNLESPDKIYEGQVLKLPRL
ncbi:LysM peptidoglycan-binding domain-containing protein [Defluviitalea phaphyphila]|uniref:LysM peptidoglycan-binding domain-containing protein n=1 Tax=Defluviitalea phaphyphila TaxID=1473580 RepID=UPI0007307D6A|nr:LysM peptidoglycan-binding domain-containing protein [Defluviitalea phaphyphila]